MSGAYHDSAAAPSSGAVRRQTVDGPCFDEVWDAIIGGAGPAGAAAALVLARAGHRVLLLERRPFPRDKPCGDGLTRKALDALAGLGVLDDVAARAHRLVVGRVIGATGRSVAFPITCLTLRRREFDELLVRRAVEAGAVFRRGEVKAVADDGGRVRIGVAGAGEGRPLIGRYAVLATGAAGPAPPEARPYGFALRGYVRSPASPLDELVVSLDRDAHPGYNWVFPAGAGVFNVGTGVITGAAGCARDLRRVLARFAALPHVPKAEAGPPCPDGLAELKGAPLRCALGGRLPPLRGRVLAAGDAIGSTYPFTGEGISVALWTGHVAAEAVAAALAVGSPAPLARRYAERLEAELRPHYRRYLITARLMYVPGVAAAVVGALARSEALWRASRRLSRELAPAGVATPWRPARP